MSTEQKQVPEDNPVPVEVTKDQLIAQVKKLTENQNSLIDTINALHRRAKDPVLNFATPDPIKNIPNFSGNRKETLAWIEDTEQTLELFEDYEDDLPTYRQIIRVIKSKIVGEAREVLIASGNPKEWDEIKEVLLNSFGDKRDITSHIQSLFYIRQGKHSLNEYYHKMKSIDTAIKTTAAQMKDYKSSTEAVNKLISLMTLTRYIDGLNGEQLSMYVRSYRPKSLEEAHDISMQHSNASFRQRLEKGPAITKNFENKNINTPEKTKFNYSHTAQSKPSGSGKFKNQKNNLDDDVSMRTAKSRMEVNNHDDSWEADCKCSNLREREYETAQQPDDSVLEPDDDEYFCEDELNFQVADAPGIKS